MIRYKLLCTFSNTNKLDRTLDLIEDNFTNIEKIFIFANKSNPYEKYLTFNIDLNLNRVYNNFISIHRKKETNTLYSVNAINVIIAEINGGVIDPSIELNWEEYRNSLLLSKRNQINIVPLLLEEIVEY